MSGTRSTLHRRLSCFVEWLAPDKDKEDEIRKQADSIRKRISGQAKEDGLTVRSTPQAGSFAKRTGLRRHMAGDSEVEGLDVDLPFVVSPTDEDGEQLESLLDRFETYARKTYPDTKRKRTKSSIELYFTGTRRRYDLVPMLASEDPDKQIIIRANGDRIETSVQKHVEFVRERTRTSNELEGRVKFNECIRLIKWWRLFREKDSDLEIPSFILALLCADAYDQQSVKETYGDTLAAWYSRMAHVVRKRKRVAFGDFVLIPAADPDARWEVLDPVTPDNNVVARWAGYEIEEFAEWLEHARDVWPRAIRCDQDGDDSGSLQHLIELFGNPIKHHCGD